MHLLFTDETNLTPDVETKVKFFAYGGLIVPLKNFLSIDEKITKLREEYGYKKTDSLKFSSKNRPKDVTPEKFAQIKDSVIDICLEEGCKFLVYVVLHEIAEKQTINKTLKWGADHIVGKFNYYLSSEKSKGFVFVDRLSDKTEYHFLSEKFTKGLLTKEKEIELKNIRLFGSSCDNASNLSSAMDIVLGAFRFCINQPSNQQPAKIMMNKVVKLLWADRTETVINPFEKGLTFRPKTVTVPTYKAQYDSLIDQINSLLN